jgi:hypothetical protein
MFYYHLKDTVVLSLTVTNNCESHPSSLFITGDMVNMHKAVQFTSGGQGAAALVFKSGTGSSSHADKPDKSRRQNSKETYTANC